MVRRGGVMRSAITSRSTRPRDSLSFMLLFSGLLECCSRGAGYLRRYAQTVLTQPQGDRSQYGL
jgi:hypothetical protein